MTGAKAWRQKGTGRARVGALSVPHRTGGGVAFGPKPRSYTVKINRKERRAALRSALSVHAGRGTLGALDSDAFDKPSTKLAHELVKGFGDLFSHTVIATNNNHDAASLLPQGALVSLADTPSAHGMLGRLAGYRREIASRNPDLLVTYNWGAIEWALANGSLDTPHVHIEDGFGPEEINHQIARRVWTRRLALRRSEVIVPSITLLKAPDGGSP